jgi:IclR family acetate operon transcriptional repressor
MSTRGTPRTRSLVRAIDVLRAVARQPASSASALARASGLPRSTVARTLRTLADAGMVDQAPGGWVVGRDLIQLAQTADPNRHLVEAARIPLERLRDAAGESALLAVPRGRPGMEIVLQVDPSRHVGVANWVGIDVPLHASAAGKLILSELDERELGAWLARTTLSALTSSTITSKAELHAELRRVWRRGYAELVDELEDGHAALAVPVRSPEDALVAAIGISGPTFRLGRARRRELLQPLRAAAVELEAATRRRE